MSAQPSKSRRRRILVVVFVLAIAVGTFVFVLPRIADYSDVWTVVQGLSWRQIGVLALATLVNLATYAPPWQAALPGLPFRLAFRLTQATTAATYIAPGGAAVGAALAVVMLRGWGFRSSAVILAAAVTGVWNQFAMLGFPIVALALLTLDHEQNPLLQSVAFVGLAVFVAGAAAFALALSTPRLARRVGDLAARVVSRGLQAMRRGPASWSGESLVRFRGDAIRLLSRRWHLLTLATLAGHLTVFLLLVACLRVFGVSAGEVDVIQAFAAWSIVRLLGSLPITPGGIGIVEVGLTGALIGFGGDNAGVVAAVLVYRFLAIFPTLALGILAGATWRRRGPTPAIP